MDERDPFVWKASDRRPAATGAAVAGPPTRDRPGELLAAVPASAALAFRAHLAALKARVDRAMSEHERLHALLGPAPAHWMFATHHRHARLMALALATGDARVLGRTLPALYRACLRRGFAPAYFQAALDAWERALRETLPPEHAAALRPVLAWQRAIHPRVAEEAEAPPPRRERPVPPRWRRVAARFREAALDGRVDDCVAYGRAHARTWRILAAFAEHALCPTIDEVRRRWELGAITTVDEVRASGIVALTLAIAHAECPVPAPTRGRIVVTGAPDVVHQAEAWLLSLNFEADGWDARFVSADRPLSTLLDVLWRTRPDIVVLATDTPYEVEFAAATVRAVRGLPRLAGLHVMLSGAVWRDHPSLAAWTDADASPPDIDAALGVARRWWRETTR